MKQTTITDQSIQTTNDSSNLSSSASITFSHGEISIHSLIQNHSLIQSNALKTSDLTKKIVLLDSEDMDEATNELFETRKEIISSIEIRIADELERLKEFLINQAMHLDSLIVQSDKNILSKYSKK